jgi:hypothetical protein
MQNSMEKIKVSLDPLFYKKAMNIYWYLRWKGYVKSKFLGIIRSASIIVLLATLFYYLDSTLFGIVLFIVVLGMVIYIVKEIIKILRLRKQFEIETYNYLVNDHYRGIHELIIQYNQNGFYEIDNVGEGHYFKWDKFSRVVLSENIIFLIEDNWKFVYHFSVKEIEQEKFTKLLKFIENFFIVEQINVEFPFWYKIMLDRSHL